MIWIVLYHFTARYTQLFDVKYPLTFDNGGVVGVTIFFILSGYFYFATIIKSDRFSCKQIGFFLINKYWKLYVPYCLSIICIYIVYQFTNLEGRECSLYDFIVNILFVSPPSPFVHVDGAHWFLATLVWLFIICAPFLLLKPHLRVYSIYIFQLVVLGLSLFYNCGLIKLYIDPNCLLKFLLGYNLFVIINNKGKCKYAHIAILCVILIYYKTILIALFVAFAFLMLIFKEVPMINDKNPLVLVGNYSFPWYLIHQNIGYIILNKLNEIGFHSEGWLLLPMFITFLMAICIQWLSAKFPRRLFN